MRSALSTLLGLALGLSPLASACSGGAGAEESAIPLVAGESIEPDVAQRIEEALRRLRGAVDDPEAWKQLGLLYEANDFLGPAAECYREARERSPDPRLAYRLGICLAAAGDREQAAEAMSACVAEQGDYAPAYWRLGNYLFDLNDFEAAERAFLRARELDPRHLGSWTGLARIQLQRGEGEEAIATLSGALKLKPRAPLVRKLLRSAYFEAGLVEEARALHVPWERPGSMGGDPWQREIRALRVRPPMELALECLQSGDPVGAVEMMEPFVRENPNDPNAHAYLASGYTALGRLDRAKETLAKALETDAESTVVLRVLASVHVSSNEVEEAIEVLERILAIDRLDLEAWRQKGDLEARLGRDRDALRSWREVVRFDERDKELILRMEGTAARLDEEGAGE